MPEGDDLDGGVPAVGLLTQEERDSLVAVVKSNDDLRRSWVEFEASLFGRGCKNVLRGQHHHHLLPTKNGSSKEAFRWDDGSCELCQSMDGRATMEPCRGGQPGLLDLFSAAGLEYIDGTFTHGLYKLNGRGLWIRSSHDPNLYNRPKDAPLSDLLRMQTVIGNVVQEARAWVLQEAKKEAKFRALATSNFEFSTRR